ncbi:DUF488 domain-containing protein [Vibrio crassostreae]|uniref:DUF488 domain-containing protein n=1 Tax=Vibrio crassostreae TaxID=246167 RepID=UPI00200B7B07|nr:DUF488 domain-containing protein [Vibrio crassostreae]UPR31030.1 DUF488 domain-containing protein [Vibrio crassostreae]
MSKELDVFTIGFTKKNAETFFSFLKDSGVKTLLDVRLNNVSQLAGFAKRDDLKFFLKELCGIDYVHIPDLAPTKQILDGFKKGTISWEEYEVQFRDLMAQRNIEKIVQPTLLENGCLMCSEHEPDFCHRRLVVDYLNEHSDNKLNVKHLY